MLVRGLVPIHLTEPPTGAWLRSPPMPEQETAPGITWGLSTHTRRLVATTVAAVVIGWWPAFTLGAYGAIFFEQLYTLWAAATTVFLAAVVVLRRRAWRRPALLTLLLPSLWLALTWVLPAGSSGLLADVVFWLGVSVTLVGVPVMAGIMIALLLPGASQLRGRQGMIALGVVVAVMGMAWLLGDQHPRLMTCQDFAISGNSLPPGCAQGSAVTER